MAIQQSDVLRDLATRNDPVDVRTLASALGCPESTSELNSVLSALVHAHQVKRHHKSDGILRYSLMPSVARIEPHIAAASKAATAPKGLLKKTQLERVRDLLAAAARPMTSDEVIAAMPGDNPSSIKSSLYNGVSVKIFQNAPTGGRGGTKAFSIRPTATAVATATATAVATASEVEPAAPSNPVLTEVPPKSSVVDVDLSRLLQESAACAEQALDAYVESVVDPVIYDSLKRSVRAAQAARDAVIANQVQSS